MALAVGEQQQDQSDHDAADHGQRDKAGGQNNADRDGPEQEGDVQRLLDRGAESHDGQCADHAEGQDHVAGDGEDHERRDHRQRHEGHTEAG